MDTGRAEAFWTAGWGEDEVRGILGIVICLLTWGGNMLEPRMRYREPGLK